MPGPHFLCIGQQKAASRWLHDQLRANDAFWLPPVKELHYFDRGFNFDRARRQAEKALRRVAAGKPVDARDLRFYSRVFFSPAAPRQEGIARELRTARQQARERGADIYAAADFVPAPEGLAWYRSLFAPAGKRLTGEITPAYSALEANAIRAIHGAFPDLRIILLIRHPVDRLWSLLRMRTKLGRALNSDSDVDAIDRFVRSDAAIVRRSFPSVIWKNWSEVYGKARVGVFLFDDIATEPARVREAVLRFLDVDPATAPFAIAADHNAKKASAGGRRVPAPLLARLNDYFSDEIAECRRLFGANWQALS